MYAVLCLVLAVVAAATADDSPSTPTENSTSTRLFLGGGPGGLLGGPGFRPGGGFGGAGFGGIGGGGFGHGGHAFGGFSSGGPGFGGGFGPGGFGVGVGGFGPGGFGVGGGFGHGGIAVGPLGPGIGGPPNPPATCRFWCRNPNTFQAYCCETAFEAPTAVFHKPGLCPPVRPTCPLRIFEGPSACSNDGSCSGIDKCCFDTCLGQHVCKPPQGIGRR